MKVIRAGVMGFCMGVRRAVELALNVRAASDAGGPRVFSYGRLVHNPKVLADLEKAGIETTDVLPQDLDGCSVIIRAHGISPVIENALRERGARIIDATCPNVKSCQLKARELSRAGYCIFLAGEAKHAEIEGILGYVQTESSPDIKTVPFCTVIGAAEEAEKEAAKLFEAGSRAKPRKPAKTALIGQTTISQDEYLHMAESIKKYFPDLEVTSTICGAAGERQNALRELLEQAEAVVIAGGKESSNTRRLLSMAKESGKPCALVEDADEIPPDFFSYRTVGISAGASTPDSVINEIERKLLQL